MSEQTTTFKEYLQGRTPLAFAPRPWYSPDGNILFWYWADERAWSEPIHVERDGKRVWVGSVEHGMKSGRIVGVKIHLEAVQGLASLLDRYRAALQEIATDTGTPYATTAEKALRGD